MPLPAEPQAGLAADHRDADDLATWGAWYSGEPKRLAADAQPKENRVARLFFWKRTVKNGRPPRGLHLPLAGEIASVSADLLFGDAFDLTTADKGAGARGSTS